MATVKVLNSKLAEGQVEEVVAEAPITTLANGEVVVAERCQFCGKRISKDINLEEGSGDYCRQLHEQGWDEEALAAHRQSMTVTTMPVTEDGREYVKVAAMNRLCRKNGIPVSRLVKAFGGDRCIDPELVLDPHFRPVYFGKSRYVHPWCAEAEGGLKFLRGLAGGREVTKKGDVPVKGKAAKAVAPKDELEEALS